MSSYFRMPLGFGPYPGPRQSADGSAVGGWNQATAKTMTIVFEAPHDQLSSLLPRPCFTLEPKSGEPGLAEASISFTCLHNLPWLAGGSYNHCGLYIHNVTCRTENEVAHGKFLSVLFENLADPITSGREELGYPKVFASLDERTGLKPNSWAADMGWGSTRFGSMRLNGLQEEAEVPMSQPQNILCYKYVPKTGHPGIADAEYPTLSPAPSPSSSAVVKTYAATSSSFHFENTEVSKLPTLHHIVDKLARLEAIRITSGRLDLVRGASDFRRQRALL